MPNKIVSQASARWTGSLVAGSGSTTFETSRIGTFDVNWKSRAEEAGGTTSPEELIAAAHATCFAMQLSHFLAEAGHPAALLQTAAAVSFLVGEGITGIALQVRGDVPGMTAEQFAELAAAAKENCPVSKALAAVPMTLEVSAG